MTLPRLEWTPSGPHGACVISPVDDVRVYFTLIGSGNDERQNALATRIVQAVNSFESLLTDLKEIRRTVDEEPFLVEDLFIAKIDAALLRAGVKDGPS